MSKKAGTLQEATNAGVLLDTQGLQPSANGSRVTLAQGRLNTTDGPFTEAKELISYAVYDVRAKEDAIEWTSPLPPGATGI